MAGKADDIISVGYASGIVKTLKRALEGDGLVAVEWHAPSIPRGILDAIEMEDAGAFEGTWGDPEAATPIQVEIIDLETTDHDIITIEVYNRGLLLLTENTDETRRLHRLCEVLKRTPGKVIIDVPLPNVPLDDEDDDEAANIRPLPPAGAQRDNCLDVWQVRGAGHLRMHAVQLRKTRVRSCVLGTRTGTSRLWGTGRVPAGRELPSHGAVRLYGREPTGAQTALLIA